MLTPEQHNVLAQLSQLGLQKLTEIANDALVATQPEQADDVVDLPTKPRTKGVRRTKTK